MSEDPYEKIVTWGDVYKQTVGLAEEAEVQEDGDWGEEGYAPLHPLFCLFGPSFALFRDQCLVLLYPTTVS